MRIFLLPAPFFYVIFLPLTGWCFEAHSRTPLPMGNCYSQNLAKVNGKCSQHQRLYLLCKDTGLPQVLYRAHCLWHLPKTVMEVKIFDDDGRGRPWKHQNLYLFRRNYFKKYPAKTQFKPPACNILSRTDWENSDFSSPKVNSGATAGWHGAQGAIRCAISLKCMFGPR